METMFLLYCFSLHINTYKCAHTLNTYPCSFVLQLLKRIRADMQHEKTVQGLKRHAWISFPYSPESIQFLSSSHKKVSDMRVREYPAKLEY